MPRPGSAQAACSRDDPAPKLAPASSTIRPAISGRLRTKSARGVPSPSYRQSANRPSPIPDLPVPLRNRAGMIWSVSTLSTGSGMSLLVKGRSGSGIGSPPIPSGGYRLRRRPDPPRARPVGGRR